MMSYQVKRLCYRPEQFMFKKQNTLMLHVKLFLYFKSEINSSIESYSPWLQMDLKGCNSGQH